MNELVRFAARLSLIEMILADMLLTQFVGRGDQFEVLRDAWLGKLRYLSDVSPDFNADQADMALAVQTETIAFAERFFAAIHADIERHETPI